MKIHYLFKVMLLAITLITQYSFSQLAQNAPNEEKQTVSKEQQKQLIQTNQSQLGFEENKGQVTGDDADRVNFMLKDKNMSMFLLNDGIAYQFNRTHYPEGFEHLGKFADPKQQDKMLELAKEIKVETYRMDISLEGANPNAKITTEGKSNDYTQYYNHDALNVHRYNKVTYHDVYPNIDWVLYTTDSKIKYDFVVRSGGDPNQIKLKTSWVEDLKVNKDGGITLKNRMGAVTEKNPVSFQNESEIKTQFEILEDGIISFNLEEYDSNQTLVIDPTLQWATYYAGHDTFEEGAGCSTDGSSNVYLTGFTRETNNVASGGHDLTFNGQVDLFLVKFNSSGVRQWATYFGGSGYEIDPSCATDGFDNVYLSGSTEGFSTTPGAHQPSHGGGFRDAFIAKFNSSGVLQWSTHYGGSDSDHGKSCAADNSGNVYLAGYTSSSANISSGGHQNSIGGSQDAFLVKFDPSGVRLWGTYYGGGDQDIGFSCATDNNGNVYLAGRAESTTNIAAGGHQFSQAGGEDGFLVKFDANGVRTWGTYYGGTGHDNAYSCIADGSGAIFLAGFTQSSNNIASGGHDNTYDLYRDAFLVKFNSSTGVREWGTYYGDDGNDYGYSCSVDNSDNIYLTGRTNSSNNMASGGHQNTLEGYYDAYIVKFNPLGVRQWASYYGGTFSEYGWSSAVDSNGDVYLSGTTESNNNIAYNGHDMFFGGTLDHFLAKFNGTACLAPDQPTTISGSTSLCENTTETYSVTNDPNATSYTWTLPSGWSGTSTTNSITVTAGASGGSIEVTADNACGSSTSQTLSVTANASPSVVATGTASICEGESTPLNASGASTYIWDNGAGTGASVSVAPTTNTTYTVTGTDGNGCENTDNVTVTVNSLPTVTATGTATICEGASTPLTASGASTYTWSNGAGTGASVTVAPTTNTTYTVTGTDGNGCENTDDVTITVNSLPTVTATGTATICEGASTPLTASGASTYTWSNGAGTGASVSVAPTTNTTYTVTGTDGNGCENTDDVTVTVNSLPTVTATGAASICEGESTPLTASGASTYTWDNGAGTGASVSVAPTTNTTYTVTGTDANGCENTDDVTVTVNSLPTVTATGSATICEGDATPLSASGASTYTWDNGAGTGASVSVSPTTNTTYTVTGTDANGCENTDDVTVTVNPLPTVTASADETICEGESTTISASGAIAFTWDNGLGSGSTQTVSPTSNTTYIVTGTDANGCENTDQVTISTQIVPDNGVTLEADNVTITANSSGIDYTWIDCDNNFQAIPGETSQSFTATENGNYAVIVTNQGCADTSDCVVIDKVSLTSNSLNPNISLVPNPTNNVTKIVTDVQINKVQVVDFSGKIINVPHNKSENELNFSNLPVGTYFIQIQTLNGNYVERVVVM